MDIVVWLRSLGLAKYEAAFRENEIDETILPNLTAEGLKDLGVSIVGHRRKLLDAIGALGTDAVKMPSADAAAPPSATSLSPEVRAERRQVDLDPTLATNKIGKSEPMMLILGLQVMGRDNRPA